MPAQEIVFTCIAPSCDKPAHETHAVCWNHLVKETVIFTICACAMIWGGLALVVKIFG